MPDTAPAELILTVEKPVAGGRMIARHDGRVVLVSGAIPGERVRARVERTSRGVTQAAAIEVLDASPDRRSVAEARPCGGNLYAHIRPDRQVSLKAEILADALVRIGRLPVAAPIPVTASPEPGYRTRARLHARGGSLGFFREGSHDLCDPASTGQLLPETCLFAERLALALRVSHLDEVDAVEVAENVPASERVAHLSLTREVEPGRLAPVARVEGLTGLVSGPAQAADAIRLRLHAGVPYVVDALAVAAPDGCIHRVVLRHHVLSFFQANRHLLTTLAARVVGLAGDGPVADLYAGAGLFALSLAASGRTRIVAVEGDRFSAADLRANAAAFEGAIDVLRMPVEQFAAEAQLPGGTTVIVDPPRTGMSREAMNGILALGAERIVYVSCDVATFARDLGRLVQSGFRLGRIEAFDLFPNTPHVEGLAVLTRP